MGCRAIDDYDDDRWPTDLKKMYLQFNLLKIEVLGKLIAKIYNLTGREHTGRGKLTSFHIHKKKEVSLPHPLLYGEEF
jgi:hypothetical protein